MSRSALLGNTFDCKCLNCKVKFTKSFNEDDFLKEDDYKDSLLQSGIQEGSQEWKEEIEGFLSLEEYHVKCPICENLEQVGTKYPQWFEVSERQESMSKVKNMTLCEEYAYVCKISCDCDSTNIELLGTYETDGKGFYVDIKCRSCGKVTQDGDGDFFDYYEIKGGKIERS